MIVPLAPESTRRCGCGGPAVVVALMDNGAPKSQKDRGRRLTERALCVQCWTKTHPGQPIPAPSSPTPIRLDPVGPLPTTACDDPAAGASALPRPGEGSSEERSPDPAQEELAAVAVAEETAPDVAPDPGVSDPSEASPTPTPEIPVPLAPPPSPAQLRGAKISAARRAAAAQGRAAALEVKSDPAEGQCRLKGCDDDIRARGLCRPHLEIARRSGRLDELGAPPQHGGGRAAQPKAEQDSAPEIVRLQAEVGRLKEALASWRGVGQELTAAKEQLAAVTIERDAALQSAGTPGAREELRRLQRIGESLTDQIWRGARIQGGLQETIPQLLERLAQVTTERDGLEANLGAELWAALGKPEPGQEVRFWTHLLARAAAIVARIAFLEGDNATLQVPGPPTEDRVLRLILGAEAGETTEEAALRVRLRLAAGCR